MRPFSRLFQLLTIAIASLLLGVGPALPARAEQDPATPPTASAQPPVDQIQFRSLRTTLTNPSAATASIRFDADVRYQLSSTPNAFLLLVVFEDGTKSATQSLANQKPATSGTRDAQLTISYVVRPGVKQLTVLAGLFDQKQQLIAFSATQPFSAAAVVARARFDTALLARRAHHFADAASDLTEAIRLAPNRGDLYYWRADTLVRMGSFDRAIDDYNHALSLMPGNRASHLGRAIAQMWKGQWAKSVEDLDVVINQKGQPDRITIWAYRARGVAHAMQGQTLSAIKDYRAYLSSISSPAEIFQIQDWIADLAP